MSKDEKVITLRGQLLDYRYLRAKLSRTNVEALIADCDAVLTSGQDETIRLLRSALSMSAHILYKDADALGHQLVGRLMGHRKYNVEVRTFTDSIPVQQPGLYPVNFDSEYVTHEQAGGYLLRTMAGNTTHFVKMRVLPNGEFLSWSTSKHDSDLRLWSNDGVPLAVLKGHSDAIRGVHILNDGRILSWSDDRTIRLWSADGTPLSVLKSHLNKSKDMQALAEEHFLLWNKEGTLRFWAANNISLAVLEIILSGLHHARQERTSDKNRNILSVLNRKQSEVKLELADGRYLSWGYDYGFALRLNAADGRHLAIFEGHTGYIHGVQVLSDERFLSWAEDGTLRLWKTIGTSIPVVKPHIGEVRHIEKLADKYFLSWGSRDNDRNIRVWSNDGTVLTTLPGNSNMSKNMYMLSDGRILWWNIYGTVSMYAANGALLSVLHQWGQVSEVRELSDKRLLTWGMDDSRLQLWASDGAPLMVLEGHTDEILNVQTLNDGRFVSWGADDTLRLWTANGTLIAVLDVSQDTNREKMVGWAVEQGIDVHVLFPRFNEYNHTVKQGVRKSGEQTIVLYQSANGRPLAKFYTDADITAGPEFSTDSKVIAAGDNAGRVLIMRWRDGS